MSNFVIKKSGDQSKNPMKVRGDERGGGYLKRVVTGKDKDGSPQYRYIRTQEELDAWEKNQAKNKKKDKKEDKPSLKEKVTKEHKKYTLLSRKTKKKDEETKKSFVIKVKNV